jgi:rhomboid family GlyGly-CTERM serine protease
MYQYLSGKNLILPFALSVVLTAISLLGQFGHDGLSYNRFFISNGQLWRIVTSHLTHTGFNHLGPNLVGLVIVFLLFGELFSTRFWLFGIIMCMSGISIGLFVFHPELEWYTGLSGVLHGLIVMGIIGTINNSWHSGYFFLLAVAAKLIFEQLYSSSPSTMISINSPVIVDAHLYGAIIGLFIAILYFLKKREPIRQE